MRNFLIALLLACFLPACAFVIPHGQTYRLEIGSSGLIELEGRGSGFAISDHHILTAGHVCAPMLFGADVKFNDKPLHLVKLDLELDMCLLYSDEKLPSYLPISHKLPKADDEVWILGYPLSLPLQVPTKGIFLGNLKVDETTKGPRLMSAMSCPGFHGNSGGPVLNDDGEVIGILVSGIDQYFQLTFAVRLEDLVAFLQGEGVVP